MKAIKEEKHFQRKKRTKSKDKIENWKVMSNISWIEFFNFIREKKTKKTH